MQQVYSTNNAYLYLYINVIFNMFGVKSNITGIFIYFLAFPTAEYFSALRVHSNLSEIELWGHSDKNILTRSNLDKY